MFFILFRSKNTAQSWGSRLNNQQLVTFNKISGFAHLVDSGRTGGQHIGYAQSGACDWVSFQAANALVERPLNAPCIEVMLGGISFIAEQDIIIAITCLSKLTSSQLICRVDGRNFPVNEAISVAKGKVVEIEPNGPVNYFYIAIAAQITASRFHGSVCTVSRERNEKHNNMLEAGKVLFGNVEPFSGKVGAKSKLKDLQGYVEMESETLSFHYCYQHCDFDWLQTRPLMTRRITR